MWGTWRYIGSSFQVYCSLMFKYIIVLFQFMYIIVLFKNSIVLFKYFIFLFKYSQTLNIKYIKRIYQMSYSSLPYPKIQTSIFLVQGSGWIGEEDRSVPPRLLYHPNLPTHTYTHRINQS